MEISFKKRDDYLISYSPVMQNKHDLVNLIIFYFNNKSNVLVKFINQIYNIQLMEVFTSTLMNYAKQLTDSEPLILQQLTKETEKYFGNVKMLSGAFQGRFLAFLSKMLKPKSILEIGTYTGYSSLCLAEGLVAYGSLHTIEQNPKCISLSKKYFKKANIFHQVKQYQGKALEILPTLNECFNMVFIDADKKNYANYYDLILNKVAGNGLIIADNVLLNGQVLEESSRKQNIKTEYMHAFNQKIQQDNRVSTFFLPIRDGLYLILKK